MPVQQEADLLIIQDLHQPEAITHLLIAQHVLEHDLTIQDRKLVETVELHAELMHIQDLKIQILFEENRQDRILRFIQDQEQVQGQTIMHQEELTEL